MSDPSAKAEPRGNWASLFQQATDAVFLLNPRRRLRYVNHAWEAIVGFTADAVLHEYALPIKFTKQLPAGVRALLQTMAPPKEVLRGRVLTVRRPVPPIRHGPPWWDITFVPLREGEKIIGIMGFIGTVGGVAPPAGTKGLSESLINLRERVAQRLSLTQLCESSPTLRRIHAQAELAAHTKAPVWLTGPTGVGKETFARAIHFHGCTREGAFIAIDAAGLQPYLIRSMLFGHNGLAETGRIGTIYLKSPEALPPDLQNELAEWHEIEDDPPRYVVGATPNMLFTPEFRNRFGVLEITLPSLHERNDEIPRLLNEALSLAKIPGYAPTALDVLQAWPWANNFREWREVLRVASEHAKDTKLEVEHLPVALRRAYVDGKAIPLAIKTAPMPKLDEVLEQVERRLIALALRKTKGDQTAAAELLDVHRSRLLRRIKVLGLE